MRKLQRRVNREIQEKKKHTRCSSLIFAERRAVARASPPRTRLIAIQGIISNDLYTLHGGCDIAGSEFIKDGNRKSHLVTSSSINSFLLELIDSSLSSWKTGPSFEKPQCYPWIQKIWNTLKMELLTLTMAWAVLVAFRISELAPLVTFSAP